MSPFKSTQVKIPNVGLSIAWKIILFKNECNYLKTWVAWTAEPEREVRLSSLTIEDSVGRLSTIAWTHQISSELLYCGSIGKSVLNIQGYPQRMRQIIKFYSIWMFDLSVVLITVFCRCTVVPNKLEYEDDVLANVLESSSFISAESQSTKILGKWSIQGTNNLRTILIYRVSHETWKLVNSWTFL